MDEKPTFARRADHAPYHNRGPLSVQPETLPVPMPKYIRWQERMQIDTSFREGWEAYEEFLNDHRERGWVPHPPFGWRRYVPGVDGPKD